MANSLKLYARYDGGGGAGWNEIGVTDKIYMQRAGSFSYGATGAIVVDSSQGGTHIVSSANTELCTVVHPSNVEYVASGTCKINGGGVVNVNTVTDNDCFKLTGVCSPNAEVTASSFYAHGAITSDPVSDVTVYGVKRGDALWKNIGGSANTYDLGVGSSASSHDRFIAISVIPTNNGAKSGTIRCEMTFV